MLRRSKGLRFFIYAVATALVILAGASWYLSIKLEPLIKKELSSLVYRSTNGLYKLDFARLRTNFLTGSASISNVRISADSTIYRKLIIQGLAPNNLYDIALEKVEIKHFRPLKIYFDREVIIDLLLFDRPVVKMTNKHFDFNDDRPPRPRKSPYDYISKLFKLLRVKEVQFRAAHFTYINKNGEKPDIDKVANLNVTLKDWLIDRNSALDTSRTYLLKDVNVYVNDYVYSSPDSMYRIKIDQFDFSLCKKQLTIKKFELEPRYSQADFAKINGFARDRYAIALNHLSLNGINLPAYLQKQELIADTLVVADGNISVFNDNHYEKRNFDKTGKFPHQLLQQLKAKVGISKVELNNLGISYSELDKTSKQVGTITFERTRGTISNVTNMKNRLAKASRMSANLESHLMGQGHLLVNFDFPLLDRHGNFSFEGELGRLDGRTLNRVTKPLGLLQINRADINSLKFSVRADDRYATGRMKFNYQNLSVALMKKEEGRQRLVRKGLISFLANNLVLYSDNPNAEGKFTPAKMVYRREVTASFFSYIWKTLFQGIKHSVGISKAKEAEIRAQVHWFEEMRENREERKHRRLLRRQRQL